MKNIQKLIGTIVAASFLVGLASTAKAAPGYQAFQVDMRLIVSYSDDSVTNKVTLKKQNVTTANIINLATDNHPTNAVPANLILAVILQCDANNGILAVVNTTSNTVEKVVANIEADGASASNGKGVAAVAFTEWSGGFTWGFDGGWVAFGCNIQAMDTPCGLLSIMGKTASGALYPIENGAGGKVIVTGGKMLTLKAISVPAMP